MDKEYIVLSEIDKNSKITQRELSKTIQCSVGSMNILLNKMVNKGLIKINRLPMNRLLYMLTPKGLVEKLQKTSNYIKNSYQYIVDTQVKIKTEFNSLVDKYGAVVVLIEDDEISELVKLTIEPSDNITFTSKCEALDSSKTIVVLNTITYNYLSKKCKNVVNLIEFI